MEKQEAWDYLIDNGIATEEELRLITGIHGYTMENLNYVHDYREGGDIPDDEEEEECEHDAQSQDEDGDTLCDDCGEILELAEFLADVRECAGCEDDENAPHACGQ